MNKVFKVIWNATSQSWVAVSELGKAKTKTKSVTLAVAGALAIAAGSAQAANIIEGEGATAKNGDNSVVLGNGATVGQGQSVAIGNQATTTLNDAVAIGSNSQAISYGDIAIGLNAKAEHSAPENQITSRQGAIAIGVSANATNLNSVSIGNYADASAWGATAFGNNATADGTNSTALGRGATATGGTGSIAAGTDAIANGQGTSALGSNANASALNAAALGYATTANGSMSAAVGSNAVSSGTQSTSVGAFSKAEGNFAAATGTFANAAGDRSVATGAAASASGDRGVATGYRANAEGANSTAIGTLSKSTAENATTVGSINNVSGANSTAVGTSNTVTAPNSAAIGANNTVTAENAFVFGSNITDPHANSIILGANSSAAGYTQAPDTEVGTDTEGGGYTYDATKYAGNTGLAEGDYLSIGAKGNERQLKHLAAGEISATSTDGVNGSQLYAVMDRVESLVKTGFNIGENNTAGDVNQEGDGPNNATSVGLSNNIDFNNGHLTVARVEVVPNANNEKQRDAKVYYDVVTQALATESADGKAAVGTDPAQSNGAPVNTGTAEAPVTAPNPDALTTAQNVADAINASGWVTTNTDGTTAVVNPGDKVNFANGTGTVANVVTEGDTTTVKFDLKADSKTVKVDPTTGEIQAVTSPITQTGSAANGDQKSSTDTPDALATAGDVVDAVNSARETVTSNDQSVEVVKSANELGGTNYDLSVKVDSTTITKGEDGKLEVATATIDPADAATGVVAAPNTANGTIATAGDVVNAINSAGWVVENTDGTTSVVNPGDTVKFANGTGTVANVVTEGNTTTVKYDVNVDSATVEIKDGKLTVVTSSVTQTGSAANGDQISTTDNPDAIATAGDLVNAVNSARETVTSNDNSVEVVKSANTLGGTNYDLSVKVDSTTITKGEDGKLEVATGDITVNPTTGKVNPADTTNGTIATVGDVVNAINNAGWTTAVPVLDAQGNPVLDAQGNPVTVNTVVNPGDAVNYVDGKGTTANVTTVTDPATGKDTVNVAYDVKIDGTTVQINDKGELFAVARPNLFDGVNTKVVEVKDAEGKVIGYQIDANKDLVDVNSIQINGPKGADGVNGKDGATLTVAQGPAGVDGQDGESKTRIVYQPLDKDSKPVVDANGNPVVENVATLNDGMKFVGDDGQVVVKKLNETLTVKGNSGNKELTNGNIGVVNENGNMIVKLAKDVDLGSNGSVKAGSVTVAGKDGANVALTSNRGPSFNTAGKADGGSVDVLNVGTAGKPTRVTNVANGEISATSKDAINGSQLHSVASGINNRIDGVDKRVGKLDKRVRGVGANAAAAAALPQVYIPGKSMVAASAGGYGGASALAVGYSRASDNGRTILKLQGTVNSQGHVSGGVGVGFQW